MKKILFFCAFIPVVMYGMNPPQFEIPDAYMSAIHNAHTIADSVATITRAKSKLTRIVQAGLITAGMVAGGYAGLKIPQPSNMPAFLRCIPALYLAVGVGAIGYLFGRLPAWLLYRRALNAKNSDIQNAAHQMHDQENNFLQSMHNYAQSSGISITDSIAHALRAINERLHVAPYNHDQHYVDAMGQILDRQRGISRNNHEPEELQQLRFFTSGAWIGRTLSRTLTNH